MQELHIQATLQTFNVISQLRSWKYHWKLSRLMFYAGTFYGIIPVRHARQGSSDHFWNFQYTAGTGM